MGSIFYISTKKRRLNIKIRIKNTINLIIITALLLMCLYVFISLNENLKNEAIWKIKEIFLGISTGLLTGYILFLKTNKRDIEIRKRKDKIEFLKELISVYNIFYECTVKSKKAITKIELNNYLDCIIDIKRKYKKISSDKTFNNIDKELHNYVVENIGRGIFMKAKQFKTVKDFKKYVNDNKDNIVMINNYLYKKMNDYYDNYIDIAYK